MISCAEARAEIVALLRGETAADLVPAVEAHLAMCDACAAEREGLRRTLEVVAEEANPPLSADSRLRLREVLDAELARSRAPIAPPRRRWAAAAAAAAAAGMLLALALARSDGSDVPASAAVAPAAVRASVVGTDLGARAIDAASRGLAWLASRQQSDGSWSPDGEGDAETRAAVTAAALLAFAADGQSPRRGPNAPRLDRAQARLGDLLADGFSGDADRKPLYAQALGVRALAAVHALDRDRLPPAERREAREALAAHGRGLLAWQREEGGFGYVPGALRSDASCTLFALAAFAALRDAEALDAAGPVARAARYLDGLRGLDGALAYDTPGDARPAPGLAAGLYALDDGSRPAASASRRALASIEDALAAGGDALLAWTGAEALARHGRSLERPLRALLEAQRGDGAWPAAGDLRCAEAGDAVTTAFGVLALAQAYVR